MISATGPRHSRVILNISLGTYRHLANILIISMGAAKYLIWKGLGSTAKITARLSTRPSVNVQQTKCTIRLCVAGKFGLYAYNMLNAYFDK
jgi:hypothetical protein